MTDVKKRRQLAEAPFAGFLKEAPVAIVGCGDQWASPKRFIVDVAMDMQNIVLAATAERGLEHARSVASMRIRLETYSKYRAITV